MHNFYGNFDLQRILVAILPCVNQPRPDFRPGRKHVRRLVIPRSPKPPTVIKASSKPRKFLRPVAGDARAFEHGSATLLLMCWECKAKTWLITDCVRDWFWDAQAVYMKGMVTRSQFYHHGFFDSTTTKSGDALAKVTNQSDQSKRYTKN